MRDSNRGRITASQHRRETRAAAHARRARVPPSNCVRDETGRKLGQLPCHALYAAFRVATLRETARTRRCEFLNTQPGEIVGPLLFAERNGGGGRFLREGTRLREPVGSELQPEINEIT